MSGLLALIFAAVAAVFARRTFQVESNRDRVNEEERRSRHEFARRVQASLVSAWWGAQNPDQGIYVRNASTTPVYQAHVVAHKADDPHGGTKIDLPVIAPNGEAIFLPLEDLPDPRVVMTFTDSDGVRWRRDEYGRLQELAAKLLFWGEPFLAGVIDRFKDDFLASYGVDVTFQTDQWRSRQESFVGASRAGRIADVLYAPNDWIGNLVRHDVIEPIVMSTQQRATFKANALEAMTYEGRLYGVPMNMYTIALIRNVDLVPDPPSTFDELLEIGLALHAAGKVTHPLALSVSSLGDPFKMSPLYTSLGGKDLSRLPDGSWDFGQFHVADPDSIAALERLRGLGETGLGVLRADVDEQGAIRLFCEGRAPFLIEGAVAEPRAHGIRYEISPVPPFAGAAPARPWSIVAGLFVAKRGPNVAIARDLVADYLARSDVANVVAQTLLAVSASRLVQPADRDIQRLESEFARAEIMPAHPNIAKIWSWLGELQAKTIQGDEPEAGARTLAERFLEEFAR